MISGVKLTDYPDVVFHEPLDIDVGPGARLEIGKDCNIRPFVSIIAKCRIIIGKKCQIAAGARIVDFDHDLREEYVERVGVELPVVIGDNCWIGANAVILKGVKLGNHVIVGAGSVVTQSFHDNVVIAGNPAKIIKTL